jgi:hypothetical protein
MVVEVVEVTLVEEPVVLVVELLAQQEQQVQVILLQQIHLKDNLEVMPLQDHRLVQQVVEVVVLLKQG